ncbi:MAG TPA: 4-hydroxyphenylpyruvate dioxygenase [Ktedonobacteraceae bacterium]
MSLIHQEYQPQADSACQQLQGIDYVELYVSNVQQAAHYYRTAFGFVPFARAGLETGVRDRSSIALRHGNCYLLLTAPLDSAGPAARYIQRHGDGVSDIAFRVQDAALAFSQAVRQGAHPVLEPTSLKSETGSLIKATVAVYGDTVHSFIQRESSESFFLPDYQAFASPGAPTLSLDLDAFDHFAVSLPPGDLARWLDFYTRAFGFTPIHEEAIATEFSAMQSKAVEDSSGQIKFVLIEPVPGKRKSQIEEFLHFHQGAGIQHIALHTRDIIQAVRSLRANGVGFVSTPGSYYDMLAERIGSISEDIAALREVNVLVDRDEWGYLLQIFSLPIQSRPTLFMEIIERKGARGFGSGNIQALFRALEREQARRGNL